MISLVCMLTAADTTTNVRKIPNCYTTDTELLLTKFNSSVCIKLASEKNSQCQVLQRGINITVEMVVPQTAGSGSPSPSGASSGTTANQKIEVSGFYQQFNYNTTTFVCVSVPTTATPPPPTTTNNFETATSAQVIMNSISHSTKFTPGILTRIASDNSRLINTTESTFQLNKTHVCFNASLNPNLANGFSKENIYNISVTITNYYTNNTNGNWSNVYKNGSGSGTAEYNQSEKHLNICFSENGIQLYNQLDITKASGLVQIYYKNNDITQYYEATVFNFKYTSEPHVYSQLRAVIMADRVSLQTFVDPTKQQNATNLNSKIKSFTAPKRVGWLFIYCQGDKANGVAAYTNRSSDFDNTSKYYTADVYAANGSLRQNIDRLFGLKRELNCSLGADYEAFSYNGSSVEISYQQSTEAVLYTCFTRVRQGSGGSLAFDRNDLPCERFSQPQQVTLRVYNTTDGGTIASARVGAFSAETTEYGTGLAAPVDAAAATLQVLDADGRVLDEVLFQVAEARDPDVLRSYGAAITVFAAAQCVACVLYVTLRVRVVRRYMSRHERTLAAKRARQDTLDL